MFTNDNHVGQGRLVPPSCEPHGQAALILVESLMHVLKERSILTGAELLDVLSTAMEVQKDYADEAGSDGATMWQAYTLLSLIARSLKDAV